MIVCDVDMPGMDGVEFIRHVADRGVASALIVVSGLERDVLNAVAAVSDAYGVQLLGVLEKPLSARRLSELLAAYRRPAPGVRNGRAGSHPTVAEIAAALDHGLIATALEPIVDLRMGVLGAAEVVIGWGDRTAWWTTAPKLAALPGCEVLSRRITEHVVDAGCGVQRRLADAGVGVGIAIALPDAIVLDVSIIGRLEEIARARGAEVGAIVYLIDEQVLRRDAPAVREVLARRRVKGFGLYLDRYGRRPMAVQQLRRIPLTGVRLAPELVCDARQGIGVGNLEEALAAARGLGLPVVGNGCETSSDFDLLLGLGCTHAEGAFIAAPMPDDELLGWAAAWTPPA